MKKLWKRRNIRERAFEFGCKVKDEECGLFYTNSPKQQNAFRTLIRVKRIMYGKPPFAYSTGWLGDTFVTDYALRAYGNLKQEAAK